MVYRLGQKEIISSVTLEFECDTRIISMCRFPIKIKRYTVSHPHSMLPSGPVGRASKYLVFKILLRTSAECGD